MWVSNAREWNHGTKRLAGSSGFVSLQLAIVALDMCVTYCVYLLEGHRGVYQDDAARADYAHERRELRKQLARLDRMRNVILHLPEKREGSAVNVLFDAEPEPTITISTTDAAHQNPVDSITKAEIEMLLAEIDHWLERQFDRLVRNAAGDQRGPGA